MKSLRRFSKPFCFLIIFLILIDIVWPVTAFALTSGPTQPEVTSFEPVGTTEMVDLFTGDFNYNIPLLDVEGYPINIAYHGGITMDQEASWVGLGWNINPGSITRDVRGVPDDFSGDEIKREMNIKENITYGVQPGVGLELLGWGASKTVSGAFGKITNHDNALKLSFGVGIVHNNYKGWGLEVNVTPSIALNNLNGLPIAGKLGLNFSSQDGMDIVPNFGISHALKKKGDVEQGLSHGVGLPYNSRGGLKALTLSTGYYNSNKGSKFTKSQVASEMGNRLGKVNGTIPLGTPTYIPQFILPMENSGYTFNTNMGLEFMSLQPNLYYTAYQSFQRLATSELSREAFGYNFEHFSAGDEAIHDFNREKDASYVKNAFRLPITNFTYDIYSVTGQGIGTQIRPHRSDVGIVSDPKISNRSEAYNGGVNVGFSQTFKLGLNIGFSRTNAWSGKWGDDNDMQSIARFYSQGDMQDPAFEPVYFKSAGELASMDATVYNELGGDRPVAVALNGKARNATASKSIKFRDNSKKELDGNNLVTKNRRKRMQEVSTLNALEATGFGSTSKISNYKEGYWEDFHNPEKEPETYFRFDNSEETVQRRKRHHLSEFAITQPGGTKYVYGIAAYNMHQKEATFNVGNASVAGAIVTYGAGDNSTSNTKGIDHYFSGNTIPAYAHSYLLTAVLSPDYIDRTGDGVTDDDYGTATKINYTRIYEDYKWRVPFTANSANYDEGLKTNDKDQKGSYLYGEKEIWYTHSIESKNYVAEFYLSDREDSYGVLSENGGLDNTKPLKRLDSIALYVKHERVEKGSLAVPIKTVHFEYTYELCPGIDNSTNVNGGKLTLKKLYFTYGKSRKGRLNAYKFYYADPDHDKVINSANNPGYSMQHYDRWGNYQENQTVLPNNEYPYVNQNDRATKADVYAAAWSLNTIELPSGGVINIDYEADDYAYVQDKRAMQMFIVEDTYKKEEGNFIAGYGLLFEKNGRISRKYEEYLYYKVKLPESVKDIEEFKEKYIGDMKFMYYRNLVHLRRDDEATLEYISGYAEILPNECELSENKDYAFIKIKPETTQDSEDKGKPVHPVSKAGWQFARFYNPVVLFPGSNTMQNGQSAWKGLMTSFRDMSIFFTGFNRTMRRREHANRIKPEKSWIRLQSPNYRKVGGGARVKEISLSDSWGTMAVGGSTMDYGQKYEYATKDGRSTGVAAYEPMIGNDENPFHYPALLSDNDFQYAKRNSGYANDILYHEEPYGESFFPAPVVGYSEVKVTNKKPAGYEEQLKKAGTGYSIHQFYTAKDFPVVWNHTPIDPKHYEPISITTFLGSVSHTKVTVSQGYSVEINDMHGRSKAVWQFSEGAAPAFSNGNYSSTALSGVEYKYLTENNGRELKNEVPVLNKWGKMDGTEILGVDFDCVVDMRDAYSETRAGQGEGNLDGFFVGILPLAIPMFWPPSQQVTSTFRSAVITKVIKRTGILIETVYHDNGASTAAKIELWDKETGVPLVQKIYNEFHDSIYSFTYPAHWVYDGMNAAYKNDGVLLRNVVLKSSGEIDHADHVATAELSDYLYPGDMVGIFLVSKAASEKEILSSANVTAYDRYWVYPQEGKLFLIDERGHIVTYDRLRRRQYRDEPIFLKVIRSGRKNQPSTPIGNLVAHEKLFSGDSLSFNNIISASAVEFSDQWQALCCSYVPRIYGALAANQDAECSVVNPFLKGIWGNWRPKKNYAFIGERTYSANPNIRKDGLLVNFTPFWKFHAGAESWSASPGTQWQWATEVTQVSPFGYEVETKDTLGRYSAALYGYNHSLNTAVAANAKYSQIAFDGFEDYKYAKLVYDANQSQETKRYTEYTGYPSHNGFFTPYSNSLNYLSKDTSHTGKYSIKLSAGELKGIVRKLGANSTSIPDSTEYILKPSDCISKFSPSDSGKYVVGSWVKVLNNAVSFDNPRLCVLVTKNGTEDTLCALQAQGTIIEGWQRIDGTFIMPSNAQQIRIAFIADGNNATFFDDLRVHPINATLKSFVYDPETLRLTATLDENNYATFYEYDEEGNLVRVKRETYKGILTIQENRQHFKPNNN